MHRACQDPLRNLKAESGNNLSVKRLDDHVEIIDCKLTCAVERIALRFDLAPQLRHLALQPTGRHLRAFNGLTLPVQLRTHVARNPMGVSVVGIR